MVVFEDKAPSVAATIIILVTLSAIVFPMRVYTRLKHNAWGWDDWAMTFAVVCWSTYPRLPLILTVSRYRMVHSVSSPWEAPSSAWALTKRSSRRCRLSKACW